MSQWAKIGVAGDSTGGLIAASLCHTLKDIDFQVRHSYICGKIDLLILDKHLDSDLCNAELQSRFTIIQRVY